MAKIETAEYVYKKFRIDKMFFGSCTLGDEKMNEKIFKSLCARKLFLFVAKNDLKSRTTIEELNAVFPEVGIGDNLFLVSDICHIGRCTSIAYKIAEKQNKEITIVSIPSKVPYLTGKEDPLSRSPDNFLFNVSI